MTRQRGGTTPRRDDQHETMSSAEEIGRLLRGAREERGLDLLAVHDRLSRPITQLEALERGDLARLPDQALALSTLRRYAVFLGLDGDALALRMIDAWSARPPAGPSSNDSAALTNVVAAVTTGPDHLRAFTQTGQVPKVGAGSTAASGGYGFGVAPGPPTGTFPVVPHQEIKDSKRAVAKARRRLRAPTPLKVVTWVVALVMVAVVSGFAIYQWRPQWLVQSHILRLAQPGSTSPGTRAPTAPTAPGPTNPPHQASPVVTTSTTGSSANYTVAAKQFTAAIATSAPCWVQVTSSSSPTPLLQGVQPAGKRLTFDAKGAVLTVQVGASGVVVGVYIGNKNVFYNAPQVTPFMYVFAPAAT
ncbi:MAG: helix-turn-helix domain-containing protein [Acidimicrobiales bacterium]